MTKLSKAIEIVTEGRKAGTDKKQVLSNIQNTLGISKGNASVYYFKANQALDADAPEVVAKEELPEPEEEVLASSPAELLQYEHEMKYRESKGFSAMSFTDWKNMTENLKTLTS